MTRFQRKRQCNKEWSVLPTFTPWKDCHIIHIHRSTPSLVLYDLIGYARQATKFTIDTESDSHTHQPSLIQIEFIRLESIVILIEMCHLPEKDSVLSRLIESLFKVILLSSNEIFAWGDIIDELSPFVRYGLFTFETLQQLDTIDVQIEFKHWYNKKFAHQCGLPLYAEDHHSCTCLHRPVKERQHQWSLQKAIAYIYGEFLDKSRTMSRWSRSLHSLQSERSSLLVKANKSIAVSLILYVVDDCLAVTKLWMLIESA